MNDIQQALDHYMAMAAADAENPINDDLAKHRRTAIAALEKQVTKKVTNLHVSENQEDRYFLGQKTLYGQCPGCGEEICQLFSLHNCGECGQRLKWEE